MARYDKLIDKGQSQAAGMKELDSDSVLGVPFTADQIAQDSGDLEDLKNQLQIARDTARSITEQMVTRAKDLRGKVARNVCYFQGKLGKTDARLLKLGGHVLVHHTGLHREKKPGSATQDATSAKSGKQ